MEMRRNPDIFLEQDCSWQLREDFLSGNAWHKIDKLKELASHESNNEKRDKWLYGIAELEKAVGWIPIEEADFSPHSSWIPEDIINQWIRDEDGLNRASILERGNLSKNDEGKWGVRYTGDYTFYEHCSREGREVKKANGKPWRTKLSTTLICRNSEAATLTPKFITGNTMTVSKII
jgi:hypothetical protein